MEEKEFNTFPTTGATVHMIHAASFNCTDCLLQKCISCRAPSFLTSAEQITGVSHLPVAKTQTSPVHLCPHSMTFSNSSKSRHIHYYLRTLTGMGRFPRGLRGSHTFCVWIRTLDVDEGQRSGIKHSKTNKGNEHVHISYFTSVTAEHDRQQNNNNSSSANI